MRSIDIAAKRGLWMAVTVLAVAGAIAGCGGGGGGPGRVPDNTAPTVAVGSYTRLLSATGGTAVIDANASDASGISKIEVKVTPPSGQVTTLAMAAKGSGGYTASYSALANSGTTAVTYKFTVYATDGAGLSSSDGEYTFQVPSAETPPPPPPFSIQ